MMRLPIEEILFYWNLLNLLNHAEPQNSAATLKE